MPFPQSRLHRLPPVSVSPPARFTFPFHYQPHPVALAAVADLQDYLTRQTDWEHDFGLNHPDSIGDGGKMFGVLVVRTPAGEPGYLAAFSGKLAERSHLPGFVPPVYDVLDPKGFYKAGEVITNTLNDRIDALERQPELAAARAALTTAETRAAKEIAAEQQARKDAKRNRDQRRFAAADLDESTRQAVERELARESVERHFRLRDLRREWTTRIATRRAQLSELETVITDLKAQRAKHSHGLQERIFRSYTFRNARGEDRDLLDIFAQTAHQTPPAGAGECAAPKLLQYAYLNDLQPVALAEFWWGQSPPSEVRRHRLYYPACRGKCLPILGHMLVGLSVDPDPLKELLDRQPDVPVVYEDDDLLLVNKPPGLLSVPGRHVEDSVQSRLAAKYPDARNHLIVHRLDMSTSGLLLLTKRKEIHQRLQQQFFKRTISKRYVALLDGEVAGKTGYIDLPLAGDYYDRPRQRVDHEGGKTARTKWAVVGKTAAGHTRVHLWPVTGRTHQLRVHCAHTGGLGTPIVGDELYGTMGERLCLHAEEISFRHPGTRELLTFSVAPEF